MKSREKERLREMQLACIGKLMAGLSHEFKNHWAIIKELNGLIEDLLVFPWSKIQDAAIALLLVYGHADLAQMPAQSLCESQGRRAVP